MQNYAKCNNYVFPDICIFNFAKTIFTKNWKITQNEFTIGIDIYFFLKMETTPYMSLKVPACITLGIYHL